MTGLSFFLIAAWMALQSLYISQRWNKRLGQALPAKPVSESQMSHIAELHINFTPTATVSDDGNFSEIYFGQAPEGLASLKIAGGKISIAAPDAVKENLAMEVRMYRAFESYPWHPQLWHVVGESADQAHVEAIVHEWIPGLPLDIALKEGWITQGEAWQQITAIFNDIYDHGWVYNDYRLDNFVLDNQNRVRLIDLGMMTPKDQESQDWRAIGLKELFAHTPVRPWWKDIWTWVVAAATATMVGLYFWHPEWLAAVGLATAPVLTRTRTLAEFDWSVRRLLQTAA
jgi:hypothetical protein